MTPVPTNDASFIGMTSMIEAIAPGELSKKTPAPTKATRTVTLADAEPVPRKWLLNGIIVLGLIAAIAIILALVMRGQKQSDAKPETPGGTSPKSEPAKTTVTVPKDDAEDKQKLKALVQKLEKGKTCEQRREAIADLVELGDPEAIPKLKQHRHRWYGCLPVIGCRGDANACLTKEADAAIQKLTPPT